MADTAHHKDPSNSWLIFFFICFAFILVGIVIFFARDINKQPESQAPAGGAHGGMILPQDQQHMYQIRVVDNKSEPKTAQLELVATA